MPKQIEKEILKNTKELSEGSQKEVLFFIEYLKFKKKLGGISGDLSNLDDESKKHLEEEFADYKDLYPHE